MFFDKVVNNSMLCGAIEAMKADPENERARSVVLEEIIKAEFLCPATVSMSPTMDENGQMYLPDDCVIHQQMVKDFKGRTLLLAFTTEEQMAKWREHSTCGECYGFACTFTEYAAFMMNKLPDGRYGPAEGFVIDPYGGNLVVDRDMVANLMVRLFV